MPEWIDLHCHWLAGVDDGARTPREGFEMLARLGSLGFGHVVATPHMRPSTFENTASELVGAFEGMMSHDLTDQRAGPTAALPQVSLGCEHYFDDVVVERIFAGSALPYSGGAAILLEFYDVALSPGVEQKLFEMLRRGLTPVIAHPERYRPFWTEPARLERLVELGAVALLDAAALVGHYGEQTRRSAGVLLERGLYAAACSDAHRPSDIAQLERAIELVDRQYGREELDQLFGQGPRDILDGTLPR